MLSAWRAQYFGIGDANPDRTDWIRIPLKLSPSSVVDDKVPDQGEAEPEVRLEGTVFWYRGRQPRQNRLEPESPLISVGYYRVVEA